MERTVLDGYHAEAARWLERRGQEPADWRLAGACSDYLVHVTAAEAEQLVERYEALLAPYQSRAERPEGSRPVHLVHLVLPS